MQTSGSTQIRWILNESYQLIGLMVTLVISITQQAQALMILSLMKIIQIMINRHQINKKRSFEKFIESLEWFKYHQIVKNSLEYLKYAKMIKKGYDSKSNTNIILQDQLSVNMKNQDQILEMSSLPSMITTIINKLIHIKNLKKTIFSKEDFNEEKYQFQKIQTFKEIFNANKLTDLIFQDLNYLSQDYEQIANSPVTILQDTNLTLINKLSKQFIPLLKQTIRQIYRLKDIYQQQLIKLKLNEEFESYYLFFVTRNNEENDVQSIYKFIDKYQTLIVSKQIEKISSRVNSQQLILDNKNINFTDQKQQSSSLPPERPNLSTRRQFMKKLDTLLMMGLAKKRQEQFERKISLKQQQQQDQD